MFLLKFINPEKYLLKRGAKIGKNFRCNPPVGVADGHLLVIGDNVSLSFNVYFSTHDGSNQVLEHLGFSKPHHLKWGGDFNRKQLFYWCKFNHYAKCYYWR